jgi:hypothetical protein
VVPDENVPSSRYLVLFSLAGAELVQRFLASTISIRNTR